MSLLHLYDPDRCEGHICTKDCDNCPWGEEDEGYTEEPNGQP